MVNGRVAAALRHEGERIGFFAEEPVGVEALRVGPGPAVVVRAVEVEQDTAAPGEPVAAPWCPVRVPLTGMRSGLTPVTECSVRAV